MLALAIIATVVLAIGIMARLTEVVDFLEVVTIFIGRPFVITVIWILYSHIPS